jgi:hypothetical protein
MKKIKFGLIASSVLVLASCGVELSELYPQGQFESADFRENYYDVFPEELAAAELGGVYNVDETNSSYGTIADPNRDTAPLKSILDTDRKFGYEEELYNRYHADTETYINIQELSNEYFYRNALMNTKRSFSYGYFSKLTDGLVHCDGSGAHVRIQLREDGFGQIFASELIEYSTILLAFRGGTNIPWDSSTGSLYPHPSINDRFSEVAIHFSFYVANGDGHLIKYRFDTVRSVKTDDNGSNTNILYVDLASVIGANYQKLLFRAKGFSLTYELLSHPYLKPEGGPPLENYEEFEFALMLYEVMLPHSKWN